MSMANGQLKARGGGTISSRFRKTNFILIFAAFIVVFFVTLLVLQSITNTVSKDYARFYSTNTASALSTYLYKEIALVGKAARSKAVIDWFSDEGNQEKKTAAIAEMLEVIDFLYSDNLYFGIHESLSEYAVEHNFTVDDVTPHATLRDDYFDDAWYFECVTSSKEYLLNVDIDKLLHRKLVWVNHKVMQGDKVLGVICSGLEFAQTAEELLSEYDNTNVRGLIIDGSGVVQMDSINLGDDDFLRYEHFYQISEEFTDTAFIEALENHLKGAGDFAALSDPVVIELSGGPYRYATIAPITAADWSVVTFYNSSSLFHWEGLLPLFIVMAVILACIITISGTVSYRILFRPVELLIRSLTQINGSGDVSIYGLERGDEIGSLAKAIRDMLNKAHFDTLTGIYNRRYLDENLERIIRSLSRSGGVISILMIDIDFFKPYNDTYGHSNGDECLKKVAGILSGSLMRSDDFVARYGGEEFVAVLPNTDVAGANIIANRMLENVRACNIKHEKSEAGSCVTVSIGSVTGRVTHAYSGADCIKKADDALYMSKESGRNRCTSLPL